MLLPKGSYELRRLPNVEVSVFKGSENFHYAAQHEGAGANVILLTYLLPRESVFFNVTMNT